MLCYLDVQTEVNRIVDQKVWALKFKSADAMSVIQTDPFFEVGFFYCTLSFENMFWCNNSKIDSYHHEVCAALQVTFL